MGERITSESEFWDNADPPNLLKLHRHDFPSGRPIGNEIQGRRLWIKYNQLLWAEAEKRLRRRLKNRRQSLVRLLDNFDQLARSCKKQRTTV